MRIKTLLAAVALAFFSATAAWSNGPQTVYVNPMSTDGGNGTTNSIVPSDPNRAFRSIRNVEAQNLNMVTLGIDSYTIICTSTQTEQDTTIPYNLRYDTSSFSWSGWTQGATQYILITVRNSYDMHLGTPTDHGYKLVPTNLTGNVMSFADGPWIIDGLTIISSGTNTSGFPALLNLGAMDTNATGYFLNNIAGLSCDGNETECRGIFNSNAAVKTLIAQNNLFINPQLNAWNFGGTMLAQSGSNGFPQCVGADTAGMTLYFYNNTCAEGFFTGIEASASTIISKNSVIQNTSDNSFSGCDAASFNNIGDDATTCGGGTLTNSSVTFVNGHSLQDWHLKSTDIVASTHCVSLSTDTAYAYAFDFEGGTRPVTPSLTSWDCGCDQKGTDRTTVAGGGGGSPPASPGAPTNIKSLDYILDSKRNVMDSERRTYAFKAK